MNCKNIMTVKEICDLTGYTRQGISLLVKKKKIFPFFKSPKLMLFTDKEFRRIKEKLTKGKYLAFR